MDAGAVNDTDLTGDDWKHIVAAYKAAVEDELGRPFPQDTNDQLWGAISAVFGSWETARAFIEDSARVGALEIER